MSKVSAGIINPSPPPTPPHGLIRVNVVKRLHELKSCNLGTTLLDFTNSQEFNFAEENFLNYKVLKTREVRNRKEKVIRSYEYSSYASWFRQLIVCFILRTNCRIHIGGRKTLYPRLQTRASEKKNSWFSRLIWIWDSFSSKRSLLTRSLKCEGGGRGGMAA